MTRVLAKRLSILETDKIPSGGAVAVDTEAEMRQAHLQELLAWFPNGWLRGEPEPVDPFPPSPGIYAFPALEEFERVADEFEKEIRAGKTIEEKPQGGGLKPTAPE